MFPPPITMQIWLPASKASFTSAAMRSTVSRSIPKERSPINASPETFKRTRAYFGAEGMDRSVESVPGHFADFVGKVAFDFFNALAYLEADIGVDRHRGAKILGGLLQHFGDLGLAIDDEGLRQEDGLLVEFAHPAFH